MYLFAWIVDRFHFGRDYRWGSIGADLGGYSVIVSRMNGYM